MGTVSGWVKNGEADFTFPAQYSEQRAADFLFSRQNCILDFAAIYTSGTNSDILYQDYQSLQGKRLGMIKGNYLNLCFDKLWGVKASAFRNFITAVVPKSMKHWLPVRSMLL